MMEASRSPPKHTAEPSHGPNNTPLVTASASVTEWCGSDDCKNQDRERNAKRSDGPEEMVHSSFVRNDVRGEGK